MSADEPDPKGALSHRAILEAMRAAVLVASPSEVVTYVNPAATRLLGRSEQACLGQPIHLLLGMTHSLREQDLDIDEPEHRLNLMLVGANGHLLQAGATILRVAGSGGASGGYLCMIRSVDEGRGLDDEMARSERVLAVSRTIAGFAHEVKNPLAAMKSLIENLIAETDAADPKIEPIRRLERLIRRVEGLVRGPLLLGRAGSPDAVACSPKVIAESAVAHVDARFRAKGVALVAEIEAPLPTLRVAEAELVQALVVLLDNALDASPEGATVTIRVRSRAASGVVGVAPRALVALSVEDRGAGIPGERLARIFDPYFSTKSQRAGLGLAIALKLVRDSGGRLLVRSTEGEGSEFRVEIWAPL